MSRQMLRPRKLRHDFKPGDNVEVLTLDGWTLAVVMGVPIAPNRRSPHAGVIWHGQTFIWVVRRGPRPIDRIRHYEPGKNASAYEVLRRRDAGTFN